MAAKVAQNKKAGIETILSSSVRHLACPRPNFSAPPVGGIGGNAMPGKGLQGICAVCG
ncbi:MULTISPECIES: hypothetical protein [unclassified Herbaspirillum]|uniref:hypothetical protein n=1 Tax=unclassified Herbaspirillum TaxID=2624150 RepID=UPI00161F4A96|nr:MULTISPECIES: hypothetical protein [unclassified Herbaspirillum]MBB5391570.1 hypothetical protein [Herbaspirillum sp. SJZ102]